MWCGRRACETLSLVSFLSPPRRGEGIVVTAKLGLLTPRFAVFQRVPSGFRYSAVPMDFHKIHHPENFRFVEEVHDRRAAVGKSSFRFSIDDFGDEVFRFAVENRRWTKGAARQPLEPTRGAKSRYALSLDASGKLRLDARPRRRPQASLLAGHPTGSFGLCGDAWMLRFVPCPDDRFFGMGGKWGPLDRSGVRTKFWNTDVWADFPPSTISEARIDPPYISVPYLIVERGGTFVGILIDNPYAVFMATNPFFAIDKQEPAPGVDPEGDHLYLGSNSGRPVVYFLVGPSLEELTRKLQRLVGTTPRPPLWALGHHQSRWGYGSQNDLEQLDDSFRRVGIPCDGLWLDIDYMDQFKVFTCNDGFFPDGRDGIENLRERGRRVVPILDPGVKCEPGYFAYDEGLRDGHFCQTEEGRPFLGFVWPGRTHFPDYSLSGTRDWWAEHVASFTEKWGFSGYWVDMNDPSVGPVELEAMRFDRGRLSHASYHNQYGLGMAQATRDGLVRARPDERPFVLTRSAFTGVSRHAAVWSGDNLSNYAHLRTSIPIALNLGLSGIPFNGPDVPGFGWDATERLCERWYQTAFLFPFLRNHSVKGCRRQEPWAFSKRTLSIVGRYVRLRYKLLPYLYQLFVEQERSGQAILRPLFYERTEPVLFARDDEFFVGPSLLQAPVVDESDQRSVLLPSGDWFCAREGTWVRGGRSSEERVARSETPLYVRRGSLIPMRPGDPSRPWKLASTAEMSLSEVELHAFLRPGDEATLDYEVDDGHSLAYRRGDARRYTITAVLRRRTLHLSIDSDDGNAEPLKLRVVAYGNIDRVELDAGARMETEPTTTVLTGKPISARRSAWFVAA